MSARAIRESASSEWHLERDGKAECGQAMPSRFEVSDVAHLWGILVKRRLGILVRPK